MNQKKNIIKTEKRVMPRHDVTLPISVRCGMALNKEAAWHIGEAVNISVDGFSIRVDPLPEIAVDSIVKLFCLPRENFLPEGILDPEPSWMTGKVAWMNKTNCLFGVKIIP